MPSLFTTWWRPRKTFENVTDERPGRWAMLALAGLWSGLLVWLWQAGHQPSVRLLPLPDEHYYLGQAIFMPMALLGLWWVYAQVAMAVARLPADRRRTARGALGLAYAAGMIPHLVAESVAFGVGGWDALRIVARISFPLAALYTWSLAARALMVMGPVSWKRAVGAAFVGLVVQAVCGAPIVR